MRDGFGRQDREAFDRQRALHLLIDAIHARGDRSSPAIGGESIYRIRLPHNQRLDASIAPIAHPAGQPSRPGRSHRPVTIRYTLNQTVNAQTTADHTALLHRISPAACRFERESPDCVDYTLGRVCDMLKPLRTAAGQGDGDRFHRQCPSAA